MTFLSSLTINQLLSYLYHRSLVVENFIRKLAIVVRVDINHIDALKFQSNVLETISISQSLRNEVRLFIEIV